jgi:hypothetical protein
MKAGLKRLLFALLAALLLAAAFIAYLSPGFVLDLANRFILC